MKWMASGVFLVSLVVGMASTRPVLADSRAPWGVQRVSANWNYLPSDPAFKTCVPVGIVLRVWNIGAAAPAGFELDYGRGTIRLNTGGRCKNGKQLQPWSYSTIPGTFTGGPDGVFRFTLPKIWGGGPAEIDFHNRWVTSKEFGSAPLEPWDAFKFWPKPGNALSVAKIRGEVELSGNGVTWVPIGPDPTTGRNPFIFIQEEIRTGPTGWAEFVYEDGSVFRIKPNSVVRVLSDGLQVLYGESWFNLKKNGRRFEVITPTTVTGSLGTLFTVTVAQDGTSITQVAEGEVLFTSKETGEEASLTAGSAGTVSADGTISVEPFDVNAMASWELPAQEAPVPAPERAARDGGGGSDLALTIGGCLLVIASLALAMRQRGRSHGPPWWFFTAVSIVGAIALLVALARSRGR